MQYTRCCHETIGVGRPQGSLTVDPTYYQQKGNSGKTKTLVEIIGLVLHYFAVRLANKTCPENQVKYQ